MSGKKHKQRRRRATIHPDYPDWPKLPKWTPFEGLPLTAHFNGEMLGNSRFTVSRRNVRIMLNGQFIPCTYLGIHSVDQSARHDWREFQRIKNELIGSERWAVEFYPPESMLLDPSNYYMLWAPNEVLIDLPVRHERVVHNAMLNRPLQMPFQQRQAMAAGENGTSGADDER